jgi:hypothetical protein
MSRLLMAIFVGLLLIPAADAAPKPKDPTTVSTYFPALVGMRWVYDQEGRDLVLEVTGVKTEVGKTVVTMSHSSKGDRVNTYLITADGVFDRGTARFVFDPPLRKLKLPLTAGDTWDHEEPLLEGLRSHAGKVTVGKEESVEVPAGKYAAIPVVLEVTETYTSWYAQGVGLIKLKYPTGSRVLKSFTPAPAARK